MFPLRTPKRANTSNNAFLVVGSSKSGPPETSTALSICVRISGVPLNWNENDLFDVLEAIDPSLTHTQRPSLYPACSDSTQTALLNLDYCPEYFQHAKYHQVPESTSRTAAHLAIDSNFYNLTPLNIPEGEIIAELVT